ncbi:hypothetical protein F53441_499 [Fusarium austroafricanum]|uniref:Zn(2)-C6 fungal-type domain-containing protein n=1 Tax=Fusarium austroafricanum TaxID=2364996 RepID=A0A8H4KXJ8_9HYPO|nr:hypothetical protein F53441_499 [Fusarium austroafricanum]
MAPPKDKERKRKFHRRSKNGCTRCKARHVRCDEQKPLCTNCLQTGSECIYPTPEQPLPSNESSPSPSSSSNVAVGNFGSHLALTEPATPGPSNALNNYVGGSFDALPEPSKRLLRHSCQWAWVTGSMDEVRIPFLYHKAATYQFAREQLQSPELAQSGDTMLAISALALTEGAIGELDASSRHLKGIQSAVREWNRAIDPVPTLPQRMLKMVGEGLRTGKAGQLVNVPEYQPTFMALLFASIWDITALPPREAPRYGWWEDLETPAARLWQNHTRDLNLNYEISRGFNASQYVPRILNGDPKSSRTSFIATFFYLCSELGDRYFDVTMIDWLLEQLIDDVNAGEEHLRMSQWTQSLWLFCVLFGASIAFTGRPNNVIEERQLDKWRGVYSDKMKLASRELRITSWQSARAMLAEVVGGIDGELEKGLEELWNEGISGETSESDWDMPPHLD